MASETVLRETPNGTISGHCHPAFASVLDVFEDNFRSRGEIGASVAIDVAGESVVDLWGGLADEKSGRPWTHDTVSIVFSNTKAATALAAHLLAQDGKLDLAAPVASYWPEFGGVGARGRVTIRMLLDHTAGLPVFRGELKPDAVHDWDYNVKLLETEELFWEPGTRTGYHAMTYGWLVGEVVRRVAGRSVGEVFHERVARPLGIDFWIGLPESEEGRVAGIVPHLPSPADPRTRFWETLKADPQSVPALFMANFAGWRPSDFNARVSRAVEIPAANGITNARGLAGFYRPLANGGRAGGVTLIDGDRLRTLAEVTSATHDDATLKVATRFGGGFMRSMANPGVPSGSVVLGADAFGHVGAGGSLGFADPAARLAFGYTMNRMGFGVLLNERGQSLVDAAYAALGFRRTPTCWIK